MWIGCISMYDNRTSINNGKRGAILVCSIFFAGCTIGPISSNNCLTHQEKKEGYRLLFNGKDTSGWRGYNKQGMLPNWTVTDGQLHADGTKGDIITQEEFSDFELVLEWKISEGGNSGIFYHVKEGDYPYVWYTGIEMQVMDNERNPLAKNPNRGAGSLYDMYAPAIQVVKPAGQWNQVCIRVENGHVKYGMNGREILEYKLWTDQWYADRERSIHHHARKSDWGEFRSGHIALQDEGYPVWFRNIKIKRL
jgi:hypothetical protein